MLSAKLETALNKQINEEFYSSYLYLAMAGYFEDQNLDGCGHWMRMQAVEEWQHGMKIFDYLCERGAKVELKAIAEPPSAWESPVAEGCGSRCRVSSARLASARSRSAA